MTKEVKKKGIEIGAGIVLYLTVWAASVQTGLNRQEETAVFLLPYIILALETYKSLFRQIIKLRFPDEDLLIVIATVGAFFVGRNKEAVAAMLFYQVGKMIEEISMSRTKKSIAEFIDIRPEYANLKTGGMEEIVLPQDLKTGQTIILRPGGKIPVDAEVTAGTGTVDTKAITGEAEPKVVGPGDRIYSGCINLSGVLEAKVIRLYKDSTAEKVIELVERANEKKSDSLHFADRFTRYYTPIVILIAFVTVLVLPMMFTGEREEWIYRGLIILVAACPCGLMVSIPMAFLGGIGSASKYGVLFKGSAFLEDLTKVDTFVFDKTGTLTEGVFHVQKIVPGQMTEEELLETAVLGEAYSMHPIAISLREAYGKTIDRSRVKGISDFPGYGLRAVVDGKEVYIGNSRLMKKRGLYYQPVTEVGSAVHAAVDGKYAGYILISDAIREDTEKLMKWLHRRGLSTVMLTGDNERVAEAVAKQLGIESVYAELMPEDKVEQVEDFMESRMEDEKVAFIGDGINDAPVLARADIGIAMGGLGADAALEAADIILMEDEPSRIISAIRIARATLRSVKQNMIFAIGMKVILIALAFAGYVTMQNAIIADMAVMLINIMNSFWMMKYPE